MNWNNIKRSFRLQLPPENPYDAGPFLGSRTFEALPERLPIVTYAILFLSVALFYATDFNVQPDAMQDGSKRYQLGHRDDFHIVMRDWWGLFTINIFHGNLIHILMNSLFLFTLGSMLEKGIGSFKTLLVYLSLGLMVSCWQLLINYTPLWFLQSSELTPIFIYLDPITGEKIYWGNPRIFSNSLGLSGIVFGVIGVMWGSWKRWTGFLTVFNLRMVKFLAGWQILCFVINWTYPLHQSIRVANTAHISGLMFGFFIGMWMCYGTKGARLWAILAAVMFILGIGFFIYTCMHFRTHFEAWLPLLQEHEIYKDPPTLPF